MRSRIRGFTLIEMIVVVAIIVALSGVVVPVVTNELSGGKLKKAQDTTNRIASGIAQYLQDTGFAPTGKNGRRDAHYLFSSGSMPTGNKFASGTGAALADFLTLNPSDTGSWNGPYLAFVGADPWGSAYVVNTHGFFANDERVWILSAGPNRELETRPSDRVLGGDDIGLVLP